MKEWFYKKYVSSHFGAIHKDLDSEFKTYYAYFKKNYLKHMPEDKNARILDVGCGDGNFSVLLKEACKAKEAPRIERVIQND